MLARRMIMGTFMLYIQQLLGDLVTFIIVPAIFLLILVGSHLAAFRTSKRGPDVARIAGLAIGWLALALVVIAKQSDNPFRNVISANLNTWTIFIFAIVGFAIGYGFLWGVALLTERNRADFLIMVCTASASISLYFYVFIQDVREAFAYTAIAFLVCALMYIMLNKGTL